MMTNSFITTLDASKFRHFPDYIYRKVEKLTETLPVAVFMDSHRDEDKDMPFVYKLARFTPDQIRGHFSLEGPEMKTRDCVDLMVDVFFDKKKFTYKLTVFILANQYTKAIKPHRIGEYYVAASVFKSSRENVIDEVIRRTIR